MDSITTTKFLENALRLRLDAAADEATLESIKNAPRSAS